MNPRTELNGRQQRLARNVRTMVDDAEALLTKTTNEVGAGYAEARSTLEGGVKAARDGVLRFERAALEQAGEAGRAAEDYVYRHPWQTLAAGAAVGLLLVGVLFTRR